MQSSLPGPLFYKAVGQHTASVPFLFPKPSAEQACCCFLVSPMAFPRPGDSFMGMYMCMCTRLWGSTCVHCAYTCVQVFDNHTCCPPFFQGQGLFLAWNLPVGLGWQATKLQGSSHLLLPVTGTRGNHCSHGFWRLNSGPHDYTTEPPPQPQVLESHLSHGTMVFPGSTGM